MKMLRTIVRQDDDRLTNWREALGRFGIASVPVAGMFPLAANLRTTDQEPWDNLDSQGIVSPRVVARFLSGQLVPEAKHWQTHAACSNKHLNLKDAQVSRSSNDQNTRQEGLPAI